MALGRPTTFNDALSAKMVALYEQGKTDSEVAELIGVSPRTIYYWKNKHADFLQSLKQAKNIADGLVEAALFSRAVGYTRKVRRDVNYHGVKLTLEEEQHYPPDTTACIFWLKNRQPEKWRDTHVLETPPQRSEKDVNVSYQEFCEIAGYPEPFPKQIEMYEFGMHTEGPHLILGSRGYGKTDYITVMGTAYEIYKNLQYRVLLISKSEERNASMLNEIGKALVANGVQLEKENASCIRVNGLHGKDHSVATVTIGSSAIRGRHPDLVIMDDPVTEEDASEATRARVQRVYNEVNKLCQNILIIGQPVHKFDLYETLRPLVKKMEVPHGTIPELDMNLEVQRMAGVSEESIQASFFLKVTSETTNPLDGIKYIDQYPQGDSVAFIDPSFEGGDYTALTILRGHFGGVAVQGFCFKKAWYHCIEDMIKRMHEFGVKKLCFETNSLGDQPIIMLREKCGNIGVIGKKSTGHKHSRIVAAGAFAHLIHLSRTSDRVYIDQVVKYEYNSEYDDAPDSLASCLEWVGLTRGKR